MHEQVTEGNMKAIITPEYYSEPGAITVTGASSVTFTVTCAHGKPLQHLHHNVQSYQKYTEQWFSALTEINILFNLSVLLVII